MNKSIIVSLGVVLALACGGFYLYKPDLVKKTLGLSYTDEIGAYVGRNLDAATWADAKEVQKVVGPQILERLGTISAQSVDTFMKSPENQLLIAQWMLAQKFIDSEELDTQTAKTRAEGLKKAQDTMKNLQAKLPANKNKLSHRQAHNLKNAERDLAEQEAESNGVKTIKELLSTKEGLELVDAVTNNLELAKQFAFSGECKQPAKAISILAAISKKDATFGQNKITRDMATASALEFARYNWLLPGAVSRYEYYAKHWKAGDLNSVFDTLPYWQRRILGGAKGDNHFATPESFEWALENVKLPAEMYSGSCWRCGYKLFNPYGESIHGSNFVEPFMEAFDRNRIELTYRVGGVCGFLSHFGAYSACANGVPAFTAGEPGHCAFVVLVGDKWTPSYSLSWERGLHWQIFEGVHFFSSLHMATDFFKPENAEASQRSDAFRVIAGEMARQGNVDKALQYYNEAVTAQPLNYWAWREYAKYIKDKAPNNVGAWTKLNRQICKLLAPVYPEMAATLLSSHVYDGMNAVMGENNRSGLVEELMHFWGCVKEMGPDRWRIEQHITKQMQVLGIGERDGTKVPGFASKLITELASSPKYLPVAFSWANNISDKLPKQEDKQKLLFASVKALSHAQGSGDAKDNVQILAPLVLASEKARDMNTFQAIRKMLPKDYGKCDIPKFEAFPGKLVSQGGLVWTSSTCRHDAPCEHPAVLEPTGGRFHSDKEENPWIAVQLTKQANLEGIVVVLTSHNMQRCYDIHVQISESGKDDDWHDVQVVPKPGRVIRVDLQGNRPLAKFVRIKRGGTDKQFFHLNGIYVYGQPAA